MTKIAYAGFDLLSPALKNFWRRLSADRTFYMPGRRDNGIESGSNRYGREGRRSLDHEKNWKGGYSSA